MKQRRVGEREGRRASRRERLRAGLTNSTGDVYVSEFHAGIEKFDGSGTFLTAWSGGFNSKHVGVATDASGNVYVVDYGNNRVQKFACP